MSLVKELVLSSRVGRWTAQHQCKQDQTVTLNKNKTKLLLVCIHALKKLKPNTKKHLACEKPEKTSLITPDDNEEVNNSRHAKFTLDCKSKYKINNCLHMQFSTWSVCRDYSHYCHTITQYSEVWIWELNCSCCAQGEFKERNSGFVPLCSPQQTARSCFQYSNIPNVPGAHLFSLG